MGTTTTRYSEEVRERAVRLVFEQQREHGSEWAAIQSVAGRLGCTWEALRRWVRQTQRDTGLRGGLTTSVRDRLKALEQENRELKRANEILRKASALLAQAELDRRQISAGLDGTPREAAKARILLREILDGGVSLIRRGEELWAQIELRPAALLLRAVGTDGSGGAHPVQKSLIPLGRPKDPRRRSRLQAGRRRD